MIFGHPRSAPDALSTCVSRGRMERGVSVAFAAVPLSPVGRVAFRVGTVSDQTASSTNARSIIPTFMRGTVE